jgi:hypothetical protein
MRRSDGGLYVSDDLKGGGRGVFSDISSFTWRD